MAIIFESLLVTLYTVGRKKCENVTNFTAQKSVSLTVQILIFYPII